MRYPGERPMGLSIVSILWGISGGLTVLIGLITVIAGAAFASWIGAVDSNAGGTAFLIGLMFGLVFIAIGGFGFAVAVGLWNMRAWAWWVAVVLTGLTVLLELLSLLTVPLAFLSVGTLLFLLLHIGTLVYLLMDEARDACGISAGGSRPMPRPAAHREDVCPNPACRTPVRSSWRFCAVCSTPLEFASSRRARR